MAWLTPREIGLPEPPAERIERAARAIAVALDYDFLFTDEHYSGEMWDDDREKYRTIARAVIAAIDVPQVADTPPSL